MACRSRWLVFKFFAHILPPVAMPDTELSFEDGLHQIRALALQMEKPDLPLAEFDALYARANELVEHCSAVLRRSEEQLNHGR